MAEYLSYDEYLARGGTLAEAEFRACEARARSRVDAMTYGRVRRMAEVPEAVKDAMMVAIGVSAASGAQAMAASESMAGFSVDGYSETYQSAGERWEAVNRAANGEIRALLGGVCDDGGVPLTYAGGLG